MKKTCPQCGAPLEEDLVKNSIHCPYCGYTKILPKKAEPSTKKTIPQEKVEQVQYKTITNTGSRQRKRNFGCIGSFIRPFFGLLFFLIFIRSGLLTTVFQSNPVKESINPFDFVDVVFSGPNTRGRAEVSYLGNTKNPNVGAGNLNCYLSKSSSLKEGESIELNCSSTTYHLTESRKNFEVVGLDTPLTDLDHLSEEAWKMILQNAQTTCKKTYDSVNTDTVEILNVKPVAAYLFYNENYNNKFYQVFQVDYGFKTGEESSRYVAAIFEDLIVWDGPTPSMHDSYTMYMGDVISISDENDYIAFISGYFSLEDALADFQKDQEGPMALKEHYFE